MTQIHPTDVIVLGSANIDEVVYTTQLPTIGEPVTGRSSETGPGGKGANQAIVAARAGAAATMIRAVGTDPLGDKMLRR